MGKNYLLTYNTYICQSNQVPDGSSSINTTVVRSVSKLAAAFISFSKSAVGDTHVMKEYNNFYHPNVLFELSRKWILQFRP